jgi:hypothetical protein
MGEIALLLCVCCAMWLVVCALVVMWIAAAVDGNN